MILAVAHNLLTPLSKLRDPVCSGGCILEANLTAREEVDAIEVTEESAIGKRPNFFCC